jgi:hypothetical protein
LVRRCCFEMRVIPISPPVTGFLHSPPNTLLCHCRGDAGSPSCLICPARSLAESATSLHYAVILVTTFHEEASRMARQAKLFLSSSGSAVRGFLKFRANIPPRWIGNARRSRKQIEPEIVKALRSMKSIRINRPRARVALRNADKQFKALLSRWETAYDKENFYRGIRILLELQRNGSSRL